VSYQVELEALRSGADRVRVGPDPCRSPGTDD